MRRQRLPSRVQVLWLVAAVLAIGLILALAFR
jgi:hypothetical protein